MSRLIPLVVAAIMEICASHAWAQDAHRPFVDGLMLLEVRKIPEAISKFEEGLAAEYLSGPVQVVRSGRTSENHC